MSRHSKQTALARFNDKVKKGYRWNFTVLLLDRVFAPMGMSFAASSTVLPAFARHLTSSNLLIGLVPSINTLGWLIPQILVANFIQKLKRKKVLIIFSGLGEKIPFLFLFLAAMFLSSSSSLLLATFLIIYALSCFSGGIGAPAQEDLFAKVIPVRKRGRFFGWTTFLGAGTGIFAAFFSVRLLKNFPFPRNFALCFLFASITMLISSIFFVLVKEPVHPVKNKEFGLKDYLRQLPSLLRKDKNFSSFLISSMFLSCGIMATSFFVVHAMNKLTLPDGQIGIFTISSLAGQTISSILLGYLGDKKGYKLMMELGVLLTMLATLLAIFSSSVYLFYGVFFISGCALTASWISSSGIILELSTSRIRPTYVALANTVKAPFLGLSPLIGGFLADKISFSFVFVLTIFILLGGLLYLIFLVKEPRHLPPRLPGRSLVKKDEKRP